MWCIPGRAVGKSTSFAKGRLKMVYVPLPQGADRAAAEDSWRKLAKDMLEKGPLFWAEKMDAAKKAGPELVAFLREELDNLQAAAVAAEKAKTAKVTKAAPAKATKTAGV
jgi:hypothetical protein